MKKLILSLISLVMILSIYGCSDESQNQPKENKETDVVQEQQPKQEEDSSPKYERVALMNFLKNATNNGCDIVDPERNGDVITAYVKDLEKNEIIDDFYIEYTVEDQKVTTLKIVTIGYIFPGFNQRDNILGLLYSINPELDINKAEEFYDKYCKFANKGEAKIGSNKLEFDEENLILTSTMLK